MKERERDVYSKLFGEVIVVAVPFDDGIVYALHLTSVTTRVYDRGR